MEKAAQTQKLSSKVYCQERWKGNMEISRGEILNNSCLEGNKAKEGENNMT